MGVTSTEDSISTLTVWGKDQLTDQQLGDLRRFVNLLGRDRIYTDTSADLSPTGKSRSISMQLFDQIVSFLEYFNVV